MPCDAPVMTATFLSRLTLVSFILLRHETGAGALEMGLSVRLQQPAEMAFSYPLAL